MAIVFAGIFAFISACLIVVNEYLEFQKEIKVVEENYIQSQKKSASSQMSLLSNIVEYRFAQSHTLSKEKILAKIKEDIRYITSEMEEKKSYFCAYQKWGSGL